VEAKIAVRSVVEKSLLESELTRIGISFSFIANDSPILGQNASDSEFGYFIVDERSSELVLETLSNFRSDVLADVEEKPVRSWYQNPRVLVPGLAIFVLGCAVLVLVFLNLQMQYDFHRSRVLSNYKSVLSEHNQVVKRYYNDTGLLEGIFYDRNFNNQWEREDIYDRDGNIVYKAFSKNDNGIFDYSEGYDKSGRLIWKSYDSRSKKRDNKIETFLPDGRTIVITMSDSDGGVQSVEVKEEKTGTTKNTIFSR
jgi:hypothetical protein